MALKQQLLLLVATACLGQDQPAFELASIKPAEHGPKLPAGGEGRARTRMGDLDAPGMTLDSLCQILEFELGRPVVDRTGLTGSFAVKLQWASERAPAANRPDDASLPSLFTALQEQLGLKLEPITAPADLFLIDSVKLPSEN